ncbi:polyketide cyclase / dehydrase and lipid transport [Pseudonocardia sp. GCM10023141]|uniref:polyketide cyclase / dehydrase and lipid transport n=1 Tax=Pseudonocardia sp. GCM10023141 TaxID=3252653 RepID=UPI0036222777
MPSVDVVDETFLAVAPEVVAAEFQQPGRWPQLWPDLRLEVVTDRGVQGVRWTVQGALVGSMEIWLEPVLDGTVLHYFLRADPAGAGGLPAPAPVRRGAAEARRRQRAAKAIALACKARLEAGRAPGEPPAAAADRPAG